MPFLRLGKNRTTRRKTSLFASFSFLNCPTLVHQANEWLVFIGCQVVYFFLLNTKTTFKLTRQDNVYLAPYNDMKYPNGSIPQIQKSTPRSGSLFFFWFFFISSMALSFSFLPFPLFLSHFIPTDAHPMDRIFNLLLSSSGFGSKNCDDRKFHSAMYLKVFPKQENGIDMGVLRTLFRYRRQHKRENVSTLNSKRENSLLYHKRVRYNIDGPHF